MNENTFVDIENEFKDAVLQIWKENELIICFRLHRF